MKQFQTMVESAMNYRNKKLVADEDLRKALDTAGSYNEDIKTKRIYEAYEYRRVTLNQAKTVMEDTLNAGKIGIMDILEQRYAATLDASDLATLEILNGSNFSEREIGLYFKKYQDKPMILKRLQQIAEEKGYKIDSFLEEFRENSRGYDYYMDRLDDFLESVDFAINGFDSIDPLDTSIVTTMPIEINSNMLKAALEKANHEFGAFESAEA